MQRKLFIFGLFLVAICFPLLSQSQEISYAYLIELGKEALAVKSYSRAIDYFSLAHIIDPYSEEPGFYINFIKRIQDGRIDELVPLDGEFAMPSKKGGVAADRKDRVINKTLDTFEVMSTKRICRKVREQEDTLTVEGKGKRHDKKFKKREREIDKTLDLIEKKDIKEPEAEKVSLEEIKKLLLTEEMIDSQPISIEIKIGGFLTVEASNVKRFLVVSPEIVDAEKIDKDTVKVTAKKRGSTFFHLWDDRGRWTLNLKVVSPVKVVPFEEKYMREEEAEAFRFDYSVNGSSYYDGKSLSSVERRSISFDQYMGIFGETPYGFLDATVSFSKFQKKTEVTGYTVGLTDGKIGSFENFNLRGFDISKKFSLLSLPGAGVYGVTLDGKILNNNIEYNLLWGRDRVTTQYLTPGILEETNSYIEGAKITLFPSKDNQYSFNFAKGYGSARESYLKDKVFSVETENKIGNKKFISEIAFDEDNLAGYLDTIFKKEGFSLRANFRDIHENFTTITSQPSGRGELGGELFLDWTLSKLSVNSSLDIYRDRYLSNAGKPHALNYDWNLSLSYPLTSSSNWSTYFSYNNTAGSTSPQKNFRINNTYSKRFELAKNKNLSIFLGAIYNRNRYTFSSTSDYTSYKVLGGFSLPIIKNLSYYLNYNYSLIEDCYSGDKFHPNTLSTGINYYTKLSPSVTTRLSLSYRDEEDTVGSRTFLAGEDTMTGSIGLNYRPSKDLEFFVDGNVANSWAENPSREVFDTFDIRWGVRSSWKLPFSWSPKGYIKGVVFKDLNGSKEQEEGEDGLAGIKIKIGKKEITTDSRGRYKVKVRAKKLTVSVETDSIPKGYTFSTPSSQIVDVTQNKAQIVDFGLTTRSGIYGVVFHDVNGNGKLDAEDEFMPRVNIILDKKKKSATDFEGSYFFKNVAPGKHSLRIDVNSIPLEYFPTVKINNNIELEEATTYTFHIPLKKQDKKP